MVQTDNFRDFAFKKGDFNDVIIGNYNKEVEDENFQQVSITKYSGDDRIRRTSVDKIKIDEVLTLFDGLYLVKDNEKWYSQDSKFKISFDNINTYESLDITVFNKSRINVWITLVDKKIDKKTKTTHYDQELIYYGYQIQSGTVDLEKLEDMFNSIDS
jgi:hypothetical protein